MNYTFLRSANRKFFLLIFNILAYTLFFVLIISNYKLNEILKHIIIRHDCSEEFSVLKILHEMCIWLIKTMSKISEYIKMWYYYYCYRRYLFILHSYNYDSKSWQSVKTECNDPRFVSVMNYDIDISIRFLI